MSSQRESLTSAQCVEEPKLIENNTYARNIGTKETMRSNCSNRLWRNLRTFPPILRYLLYLVPGAVALLAPVLIGGLQRDTTPEPGANIDHSTKIGVTPLFIAAQCAYSRIVRYLTDGGANIDEVDRDGKTPLLETASRGHTETALLLINLGADLSMRSEFGYAPLHFAALNGDLQLAKALIDRGGYTEVPCGAGAIPLCWAIQLGHTEIAELLETNKSVV